jgi:hypothetical protein
MCWLSRNSGSLNLLQPSGPVQAHIVIALPFAPKERLLVLPLRVFYLKIKIKSLYTYTILIIFNYLHTMNPPLVSRALRYLNWPRNKQHFPFLVFVTIKSLSILCTKKTNIRISSHISTPNFCKFFYIYEKTEKRRITFISKVSCTDMKCNTKTSFMLKDMMYLQIY